MSSVMSETYLAIGDIHGCIRTLETLLKKIQNEGSVFVFLGDYIDRGPDPKGCIDVLRGFKRHHTCVFLRGNHEAMLLNAIAGDYRLWLSNGCHTTLKSYGTDLETLDIPAEHLDFIRSTRLYYETEDYFFVHAGLKPNMKIDEVKKMENNEDQFLWERSQFKSQDTVWEKTVIVGHTPVHQPVLRDKLIDIDTGCVYDKMGYGNLSAIRLPGREIISQICIDDT